MYWCYNHDEREKSFQRHYRLTYIIYITASITFMAILGIGIYSILFFIPDSWGFYDDDGEWHPVRLIIATIFSLGVLIFISGLYEKYGKLTKKFKLLEEEFFQKNQECRDLQERIFEYEEEGEYEDDDYEL